MPILYKSRGSDTFIEYIGTTVKNTPKTESDNAKSFMQNSDLANIVEIELDNLQDADFETVCGILDWNALPLLKKLIISNCECKCVDYKQKHFVGLNHLEALSLTNGTAVDAPTMLELIYCASGLENIDFRNKKYTKYSFPAEVEKLEKRITEINNRRSFDLTDTVGEDEEPAIWDENDEIQSTGSSHRSVRKNDDDTASRSSDATSDSGSSNSEKISVHFNPQPRKANADLGNERSAKQFIRYGVGSNWIELEHSERINPRMYGKINELEIVGADANTIAEIDFNQLQRLQRLTINNSDIQNLVLTRDLPSVTAVSFNHCDYSQETFDSFEKHCTQLPDRELDTTGSRMISHGMDAPDSPKLTVASLEEHSKLESDRLSVEELKVRRTVGRDFTPPTQRSPVSPLTENTSNKDDTSIGKASFHTQDFENHGRHRQDDEQSSVDSRHSDITKNSNSFDGSEHWYDPEKILHDEGSQVPDNNGRFRSQGSFIPQQHRSEGSSNRSKSSPGSEPRNRREAPPLASNRHRYYQSPSIPAARDGRGYQSNHYKEQMTDRRIHRQSHGNLRDFDAWVTTDRNTEVRSLDQIEADINNALQKHGRGKDDLLRYDVEQHTDSTGSFVRLTYETKNQQQVSLLDADSDSVSVYKSWNKQGKLDLPAKALIVLGSLGIPPCPEEGINFEKGKNTPLGMEVAKQFTRLQKQELQQGNDIDLIVGRNRPRG